MQPLVTSRIPTFNERRQIAWVRLLAKAKQSPVTIRYHGLSQDSQWLWSITNEQGETLALQGDECCLLDYLNNC